LDQIELHIAILPSCGEAGYVYDTAVPLHHRIVGFKPGIIYLPSDVPHECYVPGGTLADTIRHEFAHAWRYLDPNFFDEHWFVSAFGSEYSDATYCGKSSWQEKLQSSRVRRKELADCGTEFRRQRLQNQYFKSEFVSEYAATKTYEDFAESFMLYLRYRKSIDRFKTRKGVYRKLKAVGRAIKITAKRLT
jgi:hypothetical protein